MLVYSGHYIGQDRLQCRKCVTQSSRGSEAAGKGRKAPKEIHQTHHHLGTDSDHSTAGGGAHYLQGSGFTVEELVLFHYVLHHVTGPDSLFLVLAFSCCEVQISIFKKSCFPIKIGSKKQTKTKTITKTIAKTIAYTMHDVLVPKLARAILDTVSLPNQISSESLSLFSCP